MVEVIIFKNYKTGIQVVIDKGKYVRRTKRTADGVTQEEILELKNEKRSVPAPDIKYYSDFSGKKQVKLFQLDTHTFYPVVEEDNSLKFVMRDGEKEKKYVLFDGKRVKQKNAKGKETYVEVPKMVSDRTYDSIEWLADEVVKAAKMFNVMSWFERNQWIVGLIVMGVIFVSGIYFYQVFGELLNNIGTKVAPITQYSAELAYNASVMAYQTAWIQCQISPDCDVKDMPTPPPPPS